MMLYEKMNIKKNNFLQHFTFLYCKNRFISINKKKYLWNLSVNEKKVLMNKKC